MLRQPVVANRFYPGSRVSLEKNVKELFPSTPLDTKKAVGIICPHAGYVYSGRLAAHTIASVEIPETVLIIGPNHSGRGAPVAASVSDWDMPQGVVPINRQLTDELITLSHHITGDETSHRFEHSLEVQVPFLQAFQDNLSLIALTISRINFEECEEIAGAIVNLFNSEIHPLILASTDMSHYESRDTATRLDRMALDCISNLDPEGLFNTVFENNISMCGVLPVTISLIAAKQLGATTADLVGYTDSGAVSGDTDQVVGYAGFVIY